MTAAAAALLKIAFRAANTIAAVFPGPCPCSICSGHSLLLLLSVTPSSSCWRHWKKLAAPQGKWAGCCCSCWQSHSYLLWAPGNPNPSTALPCSPQPISTLTSDQLILAVAKLWSCVPAATNSRVARAGEQLFCNLGFIWVILGQKPGSSVPPCCQQGTQPHLLL